MQAVPAHDERGRMFRAAFTAELGHVLVAADYSQVELRVMAALSGDEALLAAFANGQDVHAATARDVLGRGPQVTGRLNLGLSAAQLMGSRATDCWHPLSSPVSQQCGSMSTY